MKRITKTTSCVLLLSLVLVGLGETDSLVLCIGDDGHVSLEDSRTGICDHTLSKVAAELGLPASHPDVLKNAKCCPCTDMDLPGHALDYPEVAPIELVYVPEPADIPAPVFELARAEYAYVPCNEIIPRPPPPNQGGDAVWVALRSVVILV